MASSPDAGRSRHVGRIVDPLVREDGQPEPELELGTEAPAPSPEAPVNGEQIESAPVAQPTPEPEPEPEPATALDDEPDQPLLRGSALRERLLARAETLKKTRTEAPSGLEEVGRDAAPELDPAFGRAPSAPIRHRPQLSPDMIAVFGTLLGLATVASLVALAMNLEPQADGSAPAPAESAAPAETHASVPVVPKKQRQRLPGPWRIADAKGEAGSRIVEGKIGLLPFLKAVQDAGVQKKESYRVVTALKGVRDLDKPNRSDTFIALIDRATSKLKAFEYLVSKEEVYQAREGADGLLVGKRLDLKVERTQVNAALVYEGADLDASAEKAGFDKGLARVLAKALDGHMSVEELERGDRLRVIAQEVTVLGEFSRYSGIEALEIVPAKGKALRLYYFRGTSSRGYYDDKGRSPYEGGWRKPIPNAPITSKFNPKRLHPVLKKVMPHTGTDFGAPSGTPVGASSYGTVSYIGYAGASGNLVKIEHPGDIETGYAHLSRFAEGLKVGDRVKRLQLVGYVGSTGRSTGPHLHFTAKRKGEFIDAETLNLDGMRILPKEERDAFQQAKTKYDALLDAIALPPAMPVEAPAAVASAEPDPGEPDLEPGGDVAGSGAEPARAPAPPAPAPAPAPAPKAAAAAATPGTPKGNPVYLTDKELLQMQGGSDDGEVNE